MENINSLLLCAKHPHNSCYLFSTDPKCSSPLLCDNCITHENPNNYPLILIDDVINWKQNQIL